MANRCNPNATLKPLNINDFWVGDEWNEMELWLVAEVVGLADEVIEEILHVPFDRGEQDRGRWKLTCDGNFSSSSAWDWLEVELGGGL